ncbi:chemotaxis protein CheD [Caldichromatium japonicum]|uniref:Probable chemoreceptor glutamine deamidase CheD n=1 Tax=Caldichromatium japonicum TaxID=2699430 RepID=A0A6G7VA88_9GAMM|nr:chemotaxis protein CheD [Caldichromatium japonicum]QIK36979.1 chemotaxis protein CheD [Caldichromatium japonicum]
MPELLKRYLIYPGEHFVTREPMILSTLLGSCVAVCLFDPEARVMGMNHFLLPMRHPESTEPLLASEAGRYGVWAMEILVNGLLKQGARRERLRAKAFGGANVLNGHGATTNHFNIGAANALFVRDFLERDGIPLIAQDLGGVHGRQIHFHGGDYSVFMRRIPRSGIATVVRDEERYLDRASRSRRQQSGSPAKFF